MRVVARLVHQLTTVKLRSVHAVKEFLPSVSVAYECECSATQRLFIVSVIVLFVNTLYNVRQKISMLEINLWKVS
jgi:hypothetical protein